MNTLEFKKYNRKYIIVQSFDDTKLPADDEVLGEGVVIVYAPEGVLANAEQIKISDGITQWGQLPWLTDFELPELTNPASASDVLSGKEFIKADGSKDTGTIVTRTQSSVYSSGKTVYVPAGYYASTASKSVTTATQATPSIDVSTTGLITASATQSAGYVTSGTKSATKQLTTKAATTYVPGVSAQTIAQGTYLTGVQTIQGDSDLKPENIKNGVTIFNVAGTYEGEGCDHSFTTLDVKSSGTFYASNSNASGYSSVTVKAGSASTPETTITITPSIQVSENGLITAAATSIASITPAVSAGYVASGTAGNVIAGGSNTYQLSTQAAKTITPGTSAQTAVAKGKFTTGAVTVAGDVDLVAANIKSGVSIFGVAGSATCYTPCTASIYVWHPTGSGGSMALVYYYVTVSGTVNSNVIPIPTTAATSPIKISINTVTYAPIVLYTDSTYQLVYNGTAPTGYNYGANTANVPRDYIMLYCDTATPSSVNLPIISMVKKEQSLEALGVLCDWEIEMDSDSYPMITIANHHPSYYLICDVDSSLGSYKVLDLVVGPNQTYSHTPSDTLSESEYLKITNIRWSKNSV